MDTTKNLQWNEEHRRLQLHQFDEDRIGEYERIIEKLEIENQMLYQQISRLNEEILDLKSLEFQSMPREERDRQAYMSS